MESFMMSNGIALRVNDQGEGCVIVLLHGYLEILEIWEPFAILLAKHYRIISLDLPGHGLSGWNGGIHTMEFMADTIKGVLDKLQIKECLMVGRSMGGYVTLAFAKKYNDMLKGICLFHSTPNPDTEEKKINRDREIELIREDKLGLIAAQAIPNIFASGNLKKYKETIEEIKVNVEFADKDGIIACLQGMKEREDMNDFLLHYSKPILLVLGKNDNLIGWDVAESLIDKFKNAEVLVLENSGHVGFIEEQEAAEKGLLAFATKVFSEK
ncbi:MAG: alpha/beta hydrolase [Prevotellaceae bacterium]|jgi:pimeloyl-ACP methyl ester carboxylesterase|nr:alpha/beta hydrolase [Prevotellaceae bacterium]